MDKTLDLVGSGEHVIVLPHADDTPSRSHEPHIGVGITALVALIFDGQ